MAYKIKYPTQQATAQPQVNQPEEPSTAQSIISQVARPLARAYESVRAAPQAISNVLTYLPNKAIEAVTGYENVLGIGGKKEFENQFPTFEKAHQETTQFLEKYLGKGANEPHNKVEKVVDAVASTLPFAFLTGGVGAIPGAAASAAAGNVASQGAEALGFGEVGQTIADIGGSFGYNFLQKGATPEKIRKLGERKMKQGYEQAEKIAPTVNVFKDAKTVLPGVQKEIEFLQSGSSGLSKSVSSDILSELYDVNSLLNKPKVSLKQVWDKKKHLNSLISDSDKKVGDFYRRIVGGLNDKVLNGESAVSSGFDKFYQPSENLHKAINVPSALGRILEENTKLENILSNPAAKITLLGGAAFFGGPYAALGTIPVGLGAKYITRAYDFAKNPVARKLWNEVAQDALSSNIPALTKSLAQYNAEADKYMEQNPLPKSYKIKWKKD